MPQTGLSTVIGVLFAAVGGATVWLIFHATARMKQRGSSARLVQAHRIGGYLFVALFCVMTYVMVLRLRDAPDELSARPMIHMILALVLVPLLFVKVLIARYYRSAFYSALLPLGLIIFSISFVLVAMTAGPYLLRRATIEDISLESVAMGSQTIDVGSAQTLTQQRCAKCHDLDRALGARKDARGWLATVNRMRALPGSNISADEARTIVAYLVSRLGVDAATPDGERVVGKALVDARCAKCHDLKQVYSAVKTPEQWRATVDRMKGYAPEGFFEEGEADEIVRFLAETQSSESKKQAAAVTAPRPAPPAPPAESASPSSTPDASLFVVLAVVGAAFGGLAIRRPGGAPAAATAPAAPRTKAPLTLTLARIEERTHDAKTFRFALPEGARLPFQPGQFLTFTWVVDGREVVRSYSICSAPTRTSYMEITVKRVPDGVVSRFLNDRARVGMTVEAKGPHGAFVFDEATHQRVVLLAGGSGITPMMSILRTIDERSLATKATLIYAVRTPKDVIFGEELAALAARLPGFRLVVVASRGGEGWTGATGRVGRELIEASVPDPASATYFLCGPPAFMDAVSDALDALGVEPNRVLREKFGGPPAATVSDAATVGRARFVRSGVTCDVPADRPLLDVAEANGISIPYSCRQGMCGTCATRLLSGKVEMEAEAGLDPASKADGYVLVCVGRARGDVTLDA